MIFLCWSYISILKRYLFMWHSHVDLTCQTFHLNFSLLKWSWSFDVSFLKSFEFYIGRYIYIYIYIYEFWCKNNKKLLCDSCILFLYKNYIKIRWLILACLYNLHGIFCQSRIYRWFLDCVFLNFGFIKNKITH